MDRVVYAMGPAGRYLFNAPKRWSWRNIPREIADKLNGGTISDVQWAAFGDSSEKYFVRYAAANGGGQGFFYGSDNPAELNKWLLEKAADGSKERDFETLKVVFGPGNTFFAWDSKSYRWGALSEAFQSTLQNWLSPAGWKFGPPRIVALGVSGNFVMISEYGYLSRNRLHGSMKAFHDDIDALASQGAEWDNIENIFTNPANGDTFVITFKNTWTVGNTEAKEAFQQVAHTYASDAIMEHYRKEMAEAEAERKKKDNARAAEDQRKKQAAEEERRNQAAKEARDEELRLQYALWLSTCTVLQSGSKPVTIFPHLPADACNCTQPSCKIRKKDTTLLACRHDVELLLRASGNYSLAWLRVERLAWHPDRFGRRCHPDHKQRLVKKCTEMYAIYEELIALEQNPQAATG